MLTLSATAHLSFDALLCEGQFSTLRMNPLPRFLALALFVALAALVALLAAPLWRGATPVDAASRPSTTAVAPAGAAGSAPARPQRIVLLSQRLALALASICAALALILVFSLVMRPPRAAGSDSPFSATTRTEVGALARLAESSAAQGAELNRERDVRRRAEEDAQLKQQLLTHSFDEKIRLGRDLHDGIIQSLYAVGLNVEAVRAILESDPTEADRRLEQIRAGLNGTIRDVRAYIGGLTPTSLRRAGFANAITSALHELGASREAEFDLKIDDEAAALLTADQSIEAVQIAREAISNALRHGGASRITVRVHQSDREICLLVQDNGAGFDASARRDGGHGLGNMHARAVRVGATLRVTSQPGEGSRVVATLPIVPTAAV
jgi:signal transduction histidine kinase